MGEAAELLPNFVNKGLASAFYHKVAFWRPDWTYQNTKMVKDACGNLSSKKTFSNGRCDLELFSFQMGQQWVGVLSFCFLKNFLDKLSPKKLKMLTLSLCKSLWWVNGLITYGWHLSTCGEEHTRKCCRLLFCRIFFCGWTVGLRWLFGSTVGRTTVEAFQRKPR